MTSVNWDGETGVCHNMTLFSLHGALLRSGALRAVVDPLQPLTRTSSGLPPFLRLLYCLWGTSIGAHFRRATLSGAVTAGIGFTITTLPLVHRPSKTLGAFAVLAAGLGAVGTGVGFFVTSACRIAWDGFYYFHRYGQPHELRLFPKSCNDWSGLAGDDEDLPILFPDQMTTEVYSEPFCTCCVKYAPLMIRDEEHPYCFTSTVPTSCQRCSCRLQFEGHSLRLYDEVSFFLTEPEANFLTALSKAKAANPKRNFSLGIATFLEGSSNGEERKRLLQSVMQHYLFYRGAPRMEQMPYHDGWVQTFFSPEARITRVFDATTDTWRNTLATNIYKVVAVQDAVNDDDEEDDDGETGTEVSTPAHGAPCVAVQAPPAPAIPAGVPAGSHVANTPAVLAEVTAAAEGGVQARQFVGTVPDTSAIAFGAATFPVPPPSVVCGMTAVEPSAPAGVMKAPEVVVPTTGPMYGNPVIYDHKHSPNRVHAASIRMDVKCHYNPSDAMKKRLASYDSVMMRRVFSFANIRKSIQNLPFFAELGNAKLTTDKFLEIFNALDVVLPKRYANIKLEATAKPSKPARLVYDEGLPRTVINTVVAHVFEDIYFAPCHFGRASIKYKPRAEAIQSIVEECSIDCPAACGFLEVDQTGFEYHQTTEKAENGELEGLLVSELNILERIFICLTEMHVNKSSYALILKEMADAVVVAKGKPDPKQEDANLKDPFARDVRTDKFFRTSGHKLTSGGNHYQETKCTTCVFMDDPGDWLNKWLNHCGRHPNLKALAQDQPIPLRAISSNGGLPTVRGKVPFRPWMEGDDAMVRTSHKFCTEDCRRAAQELYAELGLNAKIKTVTGGSGRNAKAERAEFVGEHFMIRNGRMHKGRHCADVKRAFTTCCANSTDTPKDQLAGKYYSKALTLTAVPFAAQAMAAIARWHAENNGTAGYAVNWHGKDDTASYASLRDAFEEAIQVSETRTSRDIAELLSVSLEEKVSHEDIAKASSVFCSDLVTGPDYDVTSLRDALPLPLRKALEASFT